MCQEFHIARLRAGTWRTLAGPPNRNAARRIGHCAKIWPGHGLRSNDYRKSGLAGSKKGVTALSVGATSVPHFDDAVKAVDFTITGKAVSYLEELYTRHKVVGALPEELFNERQETWKNKCFLYHFQQLHEQVLPVPEGSSVKNRTPFDYESVERIRAVKSYFYSPRIVLIWNLIRMSLFKHFPDGSRF